MNLVASSAFRTGSMWAQRHDRWLTAAAVVMLGSILAGIVLVPLGGLVINVVMEGEGYRACAVQSRGRYTSVTWAGADEACPPP